MPFSPSSCSTWLCRSIVIASLRLSYCSISLVAISKAAMFDEEMPSLIDETLELDIE